jgi:hypothetical protein
MPADDGRQGLTLGIAHSQDQIGMTRMLTYTQATRRVRMQGQSCHFGVSIGHRDYPRIISPLA